MSGLQDFGFADPEAAKRAARELVVRRQVTPSPDLVEQHVEPDCVQRRPDVEGMVSLRFRNVNRRRRHAGHMNVAGQNCRKDDIGQRGNMRLKLPDAPAYLVTHSLPPATRSSGRMAEAAALRQAQDERVARGGRGGRRIAAWLGAAVLVSLVASCPAQARQHEAADGYRFGTAEYIRTDLHITIIEYDTAEAVDQAARDAAAPTARSVVGEGRLVRSKVLAWSRLRPDGCEIHIISAKVDYRPELLGHELAHCIYGRWHA